MEKWFYAIGCFQFNGLNWKSFENFEINKYYFEILEMILFERFYNVLGRSIISESFRNKPVMFWNFEKGPIRKVLYKFRL